jgi:hypothetical protein
METAAAHARPRLSMSFPDFTQYQAFFDFVICKTLSSASGFSRKGHNPLLHASAIRWVTSITDS